MNRYKYSKISKYIMYVVLFIIFIFSVASILYEGVNKSSQTVEASENADVESQLHEVDSDDILIWIDPDTNVQYIIYSRKDGYGGMGGITPRINLDGTLYQP